MDEPFEPSAVEGKSFERRAEELFIRCGFKTEFGKTIVVDGLPYKPDVWVETQEGQKIYVECKHRRDESTSILREILINLRGTRTIVGADKMLLITDGMVGEQYKVYEKDDVFFWDNEEFARINRLSPSQAKEKIYEWLNLEQNEQNKSNIVLFVRDPIGFLLANPSYLPKALLAVLVALVVVGILLAVFWAKIVEAVSFIIGAIVLGVGLVIFLVCLAFALSLNSPRRREAKRKRWETITTTRRRRY